MYHPGDWKESFGRIPAQSSRLIWKREEKTPEQLAYEALQQKIAEHEQTMKELKEQAEKLKPKG